MRMKYDRYTVTKGLQKVKTKTAIAISATAMIFGSGMGLALTQLGATHAESSPLINFESPKYSLGNIDGQNGWSKTGAYDVAVVPNTSGYSSFGSQSLRISNGVASGSFGDQTFAPSLTEPAGEADALDINGNPVVAPKPHFEAQFDIASATKAYQPGMLMSVSPDRGDGARMSYLRFEDHPDGIEVYFDDVTDPSHAIGADSFNESKVATLSYTAPHTVKFVMDFYNGPDNDVVNVFIDGKLVKTGTSWEDYYRFDAESNPGIQQNDSRTVSTLLFREGGASVPANMGNGYLLDNVSMASAGAPQQPTSTDQCSNNGWMSYGQEFKNQGDCTSFVASKGKNKPSGPAPSQQTATHSVTGTVELAGPDQTLQLNAYDNGISANDTGFVMYTNHDVGLSYTVPPTCVYVADNTAYIAYQIPSNAPVAANVWVVWKVTDNGASDTVGFTTAPDETSANALCENGTAVVTNYQVTSGYIKVQ
jgi:hypothetical protein